MPLTTRKSATALGALFGLFLGMGGAASFAAVAHGPERFYSSAGENYISRASINNTVDAAQGYVRTNGTGTAPSGWIGLQPRSYKNFVLCRTATTTYNSGAASGLGTSIAANCGAGAYQAAGYSFAWNGSYYGSYSMNMSPALNIN